MTHHRPHTEAAPDAARPAPETFAQAVDRVRKGADPKAEGNRHTHSLELARQLAAQSGSRGAPVPAPTAQAHHVARSRSPQRPNPNPGRKQAPFYDSYTQGRYAPESIVTSLDFHGRRPA